MFKKFIYLTVALSGAFFSFGQICDFEEFAFSQGQNYWNGSDESGNFLYNSATFDNSYNASWMSWTGFSVSAETDVTTPGWDNQYSAFAGEGGSGSEKYAIWYSSGDIVFDSPVYLGSMEVTNTTYAGISMRDGDTYAKQFGSITNADGIEDGTDGKDWFLLTITATFNGTLVGEIEFYLADYRSENALEHYILDTWHHIDFSSIQGQLDRLSFQLSSSDNGDFGMNTPAYFALDNLTFSDQPIASVSSFDFSCKMYPNPAKNWVKIESNSDTPVQVTIYDVEGRLVLNTSEAVEHLLSLDQFKNGVYLAEIISQAGTRTERLVVSK
jgi:hypothetical protein